MSGFLLVMFWNLTLLLSKLHLKFFFGKKHRSFRCQEPLSFLAKPCHFFGLVLATAEDLSYDMWQVCDIQVGLRNKECAAYRLSFEKDSTKRHLAKEMRQRTLRIYRFTRPNSSSDSISRICLTFTSHLPCFGSALANDSVESS